MSVNNLIKPLSQAPPEWSKLNVKSVNADVITANLITGSDIDAAFIQGIPVSSSAPANGQILSYNLGANELEYTSISGFTSQAGTESGITQDTNPKTTNISFASAFASIPKVIAQINGASISDKSINISTGNKTTTDFDATVYINNYTPPIATTLVNSNLLGLQVPSVITNGNPSCAYVDGNTNSISFIRANDVSGSTWGAPVVAANFASAADIDLAIITGNPAITFRDVNTNDLYYVRATDISGTAWGTPVAVETVNNTGYNPSLCEVNGRPAIAYLDITVSGIRYVRANDATGATWGAPITIETWAGATGSQTTLLVVNGNPAIAFYNGFTADLQYIRATNADGTSWSTAVVVDSTGTTGLGADMAIVNGKPAISFVNTGSGDLYFVIANDANGATWGSKITVNNTGDNQFTSLQVVNGVPVIGYYEQTSNRFIYNIANDANGATWGSNVIVGPSSGFGDIHVISILNINDEIGVVLVSNTVDEIQYFLQLSAATYNIDFIADL